MSKPSKAMVWSLGHSLSYADLSIKGKVNWPVLLSEADEQGRFLADAKDYKRSICPIVDEIGMDDVADLLSELQEQRMVILYASGGHALGQVVKWWDWQRPTWARSSRYPPPPLWLDRVREKRGEDICLENWDTEGGLTIAIADYSVEQFSIEQNSIVQNREPMTMQRPSHGHGMKEGFLFPSEWRSILRELGTLHPEQAIREHFTTAIGIVRVTNTEVVIGLPKHDMMMTGRYKAKLAQAIGVACPDWAEREVILEAM